MAYNVLIGGAAGQGMDTFASVFSRLLQKNGYKLFTLQDYMSRVRGGHNYFQVRFSDETVYTHDDELDGIVAFNAQTVDLHLPRLKRDGFVLVDEDVDAKDGRIITVPALKSAEDLGNKKVFSVVLLGALMKIFGLGSDYLSDILSEKFDDEIVKINMDAFSKGETFTKKKHDIKPSGSSKTMLIHGNHAIALGALAAGLKFYSAYPMTPSTSIMSYLTRKSPEVEIVVEQAEDEIAAINMALGASYAGARSMTSTSGGGFSLMVEALGFSGIAEIPVVIAVVQRPGPATGLPTRTEQGDLKFVINASQGEFPRMVIALRNPQDAFYQTARAFDLADKYQIPVMLLSDQYLADAVQTVDFLDTGSIDIQRHLADGKPYEKGKEYKRYELTDSGISPRLVPGQIPNTQVNSDSDEHDEEGNITESAKVRTDMADKRAKKFELLKNEVVEPEFIGRDNPDILIIAWGSMYSQICEAVNILNSYGDEKYAALVFGDVWPLPEKLLKQNADGAKKIINVEQNKNGQFKDIVREATGITMDGSVTRYDGRPLSAKEIAEKARGI